MKGNGNWCVVEAEGQSFCIPRPSRLSFAQYSKLTQHFSTLDVATARNDGRICISADGLQSRKGDASSHTLQYNNKISFIRQKSITVFQDIVLINTATTSLFEVRKHELNIFQGISCKKPKRDEITIYTTHTYLIIRRTLNAE